MPSPLRAAALAALLAAVPLSAGAARGGEPEHDYAVDADGVLYAVRPSSGEVTRVGQVQVRGEGGAVEAPVLTDLAAAPDGHLYGISGDAVYLINLEDPTRSRRIGRHGLRGAYGMAVVGDVLLVNTYDGEVHTIDRETGAAALVGPMGGGFGASGDIAVLGDRILSSVKDAAGVERLVALDPDSGAATPIGPFVDAAGAPISHVYGLVVREERLYGLDASGRLFEVDPETGRCTVLRRTGQAWWGATDYTRY